MYIGRACTKYWQSWSAALLIKTVDYKFFFYPCGQTGSLMRDLEPGCFWLKLYGLQAPAPASFFIKSCVNQRLTLRREVLQSTTIMRSIFQVWVYSIMFHNTVENTVALHSMYLRITQVQIFNNALECVYEILTSLTVFTVFRSHCQCHSRSRSRSRIPFSLQSQLHPRLALFVPCS